MNLIDQIATYLQEQAIATIATNLFVGYLPESPNTCMAVLDTGGTEPSQYLPTYEPTFQVFIRSENYADGKTKLTAVRNTLHQQVNTLLCTGGTNYFYFILAISEGGHLGRDDNGRDLFSINFHCRTR